MSAILNEIEGTLVGRRVRVGLGRIPGFNYDNTIGVVLLQWMGPEGRPAFAVQMMEDLTAHVLHPEDFWPIGEKEEAWTQSFDRKDAMVLATIRMVIGVLGQERQRHRDPQNAYAESMWKFFGAVIGTLRDISEPPPGTEVRS